MRNTDAGSEDRKPPDLSHKEDPEPATGTVGGAAERAAAQYVPRPSPRTIPSILPARSVTLSEVTELLGDFRILLRHVLYCQKKEMPVTSDMRPELTGEEELPLPPGVRFELLTRTPEEIASDDTLLQQLYSGVSILTALAAPATVSSIYITSAFLRDRTSSSAPAEANSVARRLRVRAIAMVLVALLVFVVTISLLVHVDKGRREIQQLEHAREEYQLVVNAIDQTHAPNLLTECLKGMSGPESSEPPPAAVPQPLCQRLRDALRAMRIAGAELQDWNSISDRLSLVTPTRVLELQHSLPAGLSEVQWEASEMRASANMASLTGFVLPILLGLLGAFTYVYRDIDGRLRAATLSPGDGAHGTLRMLLGTMLGGLLGVIWTNGQQIQVEGVTLSLAALAFFVGYSVEVVFQVLDRIIARTTSGLRP